MGKDRTAIMTVSFAGRVIQAGPVAMGIRAAERTEAMAGFRQAVQEARAAGEQELDKARQEIATEADRSREPLKAEAHSLADGIASRLAGRKL